MGSLLMEPMRIGSMELKNRIVMAPMGVSVHNMSRGTVEYFVERAKGGAAMIFCNIRASLTFESGEHSIFFCEETEPLFREMADRCHSYGCKVGAQIQPGDGRIGGPSLKYRVPISASDCPWMHMPKVPCHGLTLDEIHELEDDFRKSVQAALRCGADCVEIHAYGGYLTDQFLTERWNTRTDEYGGSLENRARFLKELIEICKEEGGADFPVIVKFTPDHYMEGAGYRTMDEGIELAKLIVSYGADALHVDAGCHENWYNAMPPAGLQQMTLQSRSAKVIRQVVDVPVMTHGRFGDVTKAEAALHNGVCDIAVIGRGLLADPDLPNKVAAGRPDLIRPCISCNEGCIGNVLKFRHVECALNPFTGYEDERPMPKAAEAKKVLVVGGGPGGCTAALLAKQAGHEVELWEKTGTIGGKTLAASAPYMKADMIRLPQYYNVQLIKAGIPVRFYKEATRKTVSEFKPDVLIWAAGGTVVRPKSIPGLDRSNVYSCEAALRCQVPLGKRLAIIGGGQVGVEAAIHFDTVGHEVTVVEMADKIMPEPPFVQNDNILREMMANGSGTYLTGTKLAEVNDNGIVVETAEGRKEIACDTVLLAMGWAPDAKAGEELSDICRVIPIGDSNKCRNILAATGEAYEAVMSI